MYLCPNICIQLAKNGLIHRLYIGNGRSYSENIYMNGKYIEMVLYFPLNGIGNDNVCHV